MTEHKEPGEMFRIETIGFSMPLKELYRDVEFGNNKQYAIGKGEKITLHIKKAIFNDRGSQHQEHSIRNAEPTCARWNAGALEPGNFGRPELPNA